MSDTRIAPASAGAGRQEGDWPWLWKQVRPFIRYKAGALLLDIVAMAIGLTTPLLMKDLIDDVLPGRDWRGVAWVTVGFFGINFGQGALQSAASLMGSLGLVRCVCDVRARLVNQLISLPPPFFDRHPVGDLVHRVEQDVSAVIAIGSDVLPSLTRFGLHTIMALAIMIYLDAGLVATLLPIVGLFLLIRGRFTSALQMHAERMRDSWGAQTSLLNETLTGVLQIQLLGRERRIARRYSHANLHTQKAGWDRQVAEAWYNLARLGLICLGSSVILGYGGMRVLSGSLTAGGLVAFYGYVSGILAPIATMAELFVRLSRVRSSVTRLRDLEQPPAGLQEAHDAVPLSTPPRLIVCTDMTFRYREDAVTLSNVDFDVRAGERVAVVGRSGCGKSSLLKLLVRLYDVEQGRIEFDGVDIRGVQVRSLRDAISFVPQEPVLFQGTLRENLRAARPGVEPDEIDRAVALACLEEVVTRLPKGLDTPLGPMGAGLSGGEKQRVAIARALLQNRPILILDEATSALDATTEQRLLTQLDTWCRQRIVIVVSHRIAAAEWADRVVMLDRGLVIEDGRHAALYRPGSRYYDMWQREAVIPR